MIVVQESENIDDILNARGQLETRVIQQAIGILEELHSRVMADLARNPDLEARQLGRLREEIDADIRRYRRQLQRAAQEGQQAAFNLGQDAVERSVQQAGVQSGFLGIGDDLLQTAVEFSADQITDITEELLRRVNRELRLASLGGRTFPELVQNIGRDLGAGVFGKAQNRVEAVYRTEVGRIYNMSFQRSARDVAGRLPGTRKTWRHATGIVTTGGPPGVYQPRPGHVALDGVTIPFDEDFSVNGWPAAYPLDPRLPAGEVVHCGCALELDLSEVDDERFRIA